MAALSDARRHAEALVRPYANLLFSDDVRVGGLLLLASFALPRAGLSGLLGLVLGRVLARALRFASAAQGFADFNPLLVGLALGTVLEPSPAAALLLGAAVLTTLGFQAALDRLLIASANLPPLSLPFVATTLLALLAAEGAPGIHVAVPPLLSMATGGFADGYLRALGALFFQPVPRVGAVVFAALLLSSRIAALLSLVGYAVAFSVGDALAAGDTSLTLVLGLNGLLVAIALGGRWFVPERSAFVLAAAGALVSSLLALGLVRLLPFPTPVLVLPFNLTVLLALGAMRQRTRDGAPQSVDFLPGTPEVNLAYHRARAVRFGARRWIRLALPFSGRWTVTQSVDEQPTHHGAWKDALDFEVLDAQGRKHTGSGLALRDYLAYRLPVVATADGQVVRVVEGVPDNEIGAINARENWGNLVLLRHAPHLYSLVCHLAPGTLAVTEGQWVKQGARLGQCGNSGRSAVPHLHFQLQAEPTIGAPTVELELHDFLVEQTGRTTLRRAGFPSHGDPVRNPERSDELARLLKFPLGRRMHFAVTRPGGATTTEVVEVGLDAYQRYQLTSDQGGRLAFDPRGHQHLALDAEGEIGGVASLAFVAAPRLPFDAAPGLRWDDELPRACFAPRRGGWLRDALEPLVPQGGVRLTYRSERRGESLHILGAGRLKAQAVTTEAVFAPNRGLAELRVSVGSKAWQASLREVEDVRSDVEPLARPVPIRAA